MAINKKYFEGIINDTYKTIGCVTSSLAILEQCLYLSELIDETELSLKMSKISAILEIFEKEISKI